jgi:hypothetical protein
MSIHLSLIRIIRYETKVKDDDEDDLLWQKLLKERHEKEEVGFYSILAILCFLVLNIFEIVAKALRLAKENEKLGKGKRKRTQVKYNYPSDAALIGGVSDGEKGSVVCLNYFLNSY